MELAQELSFWLRSKPKDVGVRIAVGLGMPLTFSAYSLLNNVAFECL